MSGGGPRTLFVTGFGPDTRARELAYEFERYGRLVRCDIPAPRGHNPKPYAFIEFIDDRDSRAAYEELHGRAFGSGTLIVQFAKNPPSRAWRFDGGASSSSGGSSRGYESSRRDDYPRYESAPRREYSRHDSDRDRDRDRDRGYGYDSVPAAAPIVSAAPPSSYALPSQPVAAPAGREYDYRTAAPADYYHQAAAPAPQTHQRTGSGGRRYEDDREYTRRSTDAYSRARSRSRSPGRYRSSSPSRRREYGERDYGRSERHDYERSDREYGRRSSLNGNGASAHPPHEADAAVVDREYTRRSVSSKGDDADAHYGNGSSSRYAKEEDHRYHEGDTAREEDAPRP